MQNLINFGTESFFQNIPIQHFNYSEKILVIHSFLLILQRTLMHTFFKQTPIIHFAFDYMLNLTPPVTPSWFADAFITLFGYPYYILTQCELYVSTFFLIPALLTPSFIIIKTYKITIFIKYNLEHDITICSSIAHGFFNIRTAERVNDLRYSP